MEKTERVAVFLTPEMKKDIAELAKEKGLPMSAYIRTVLIEHIKTQKK